MKYNSYKHKNLIFFVVFYILILIIGFLILKDYGVHIEEKYHRLNGHYWLNYISKVFYLNNLELITENKISNIYDYTLSSVTYYDKWGVIFDVPAALMEILFKFENINQIYFFKHYLSFIVFLIGSFYFFKILDKRYNNFYLSLAGLILYITSPRIFGDSFFYKDILYLSLFTITVFFLIETLSNYKSRNIILFSLFTALSFNLKIFSILFPIIFGLLLIINNFYEKRKYFFFKRYFFYLIFFFFFAYIFWPFLWSNPFKSFFNLFYFMKKDLIDVKILFSNDYIQNNLLPSIYIFEWIFVSSPMLPSFMFVGGYFYCFFRISKRLINIEENLIFNDLWRSNREKLDFILFLIFTIFLILFIFLNAPFYNGWRLVYFFNLFIIYFGIYFIYIGLNFFRKKKMLKIFLSSIIFTSIFFNIYNLVIFHPYQSIYFNNILNKKYINGFEGDYYGLSSKHFFSNLDILDNRKKIKIAVASHTPLQRGLEVFTKTFQNKFTIVGQEYQMADYIYKNNISEVNPKLNNKYKIPPNFSKIYEYNIKKLKVYEVYKKNK